jgi:excisionase family DNA binding protein
MEPEPFLTISETMQILRVSRGTIRNMRKAGTLRFVHPRPHCPRILREDVLELANPSKSESTPKPESASAFAQMQRAQKGRT